MTNPGLLRILYCAPAPINSPVPVRTDRESSALLAVTRASGKSIWLGGIIPGSIENIELSGINQSPVILHLAAHAGQDNIELEDRSGASIVVGRSAIISALVASGATLMVLNGCDTERIGRTVSRSTSASIICTTGFLPDDIAVRFVESFYPLLLATGSVTRSFESANRAINESFGYTPYFLFEGVNVEKGNSGSFTIDQTFLWVRARSQLQSFWGHRKELLELYSFLVGASGPMLWITGAPLAGTSTFLRAASMQYAWMFRQNPVYIDLRSVIDIREIDEKASNALAMMPPISFEELVLRSSVLLILDHFDRMPPVIAKEVYAKLATIPDSCPSRILIGTSLFPNSDQSRHPILLLGELEFAEAFALLSSIIGNDKAGRYRHVLQEMPRLPGRIVTLASDIKNGAEDAYLADLVNNGDPRSGLDRVVSQLLASFHMRTLVRALLEVGNRVPRSAARAAFFAIENVDVVERTADLNEIFEQCVADLRESGLLWIDEVQVLAGGMPEAYFCSSPDFLHIARLQCTPGSPSERRDALDALVQSAAERATEGRISVLNDAQWIGNVAHNCYSSRMPESAVKLGQLFLHRDAQFRLKGAGAEIEKLIVASFEAARQLGETDFSSYLGLVLGESYYRSGQLDKAEDAFRRGLTLQCTAERRLQMLRALRAN